MSKIAGLRASVLLAMFSPMPLHLAFVVFVVVGGVVVV